MEISVFCHAASISILIQLDLILSWKLVFSWSDLSYVTAFEVKSHK